MIRIALCDDDALAREQVCAALEEYRKLRQQELEYTVFQSPLDLLAQVERGTGYDILLLDILMPGENGIATATEIRAYDSNVKIIFLTASSEYAVDSYKVNAFYYLLKPVCREALYQVIDAAITQCRQERSDSLILRCKNGIHRVQLRQLVCCEVRHRTLYIHLTDGSMLECSGSLDQLSEQLASYSGFCRPHRSYLVNLEHIAQLSYKVITMTGGMQIPMPRGKYQGIKEQYLEYAFANRKVTV